MNTSPTFIRGKRLTIVLSPEQIKQLEQLAHSSQRTQADRARVVLGLHQGKSTTELSQILGYHPAAIRRIKSRFLHQGILAIQARKHTGRTPHKQRLVQQYLPNLDVCGKLQSAQGNPLSIKEIAQQVEKCSGVPVGTKTVRTVLKKKLSLATSSS